jgi:hypothetical protein
LDLKALHAEFPRDRIEWRPQGSVSKNGSILALAYIDARDVMDRLDEVCGPANWQDSYAETPKGRVLCTISLRIGDEWVSKSDGAGETQVEGDKGAISDALKRAAVKWGIGRYLYSIESPWVPCETYQGNDNKPKFKRFSVDPWSKVRGINYTPPPIPPIDDQRQAFRDSVALGVAERPVEPPHDPETGEVRDERNPPPPADPTPEPEMDDESNAPSVDLFVKQIKMTMTDADAKDPAKFSRAYAAAVIENVSKRAASSRGRKHFDIFCDLHGPVISRIPDESLRRQVRDAIAFKTSQMNGENPNPAEFGHPFGEPDISERMVETGSFGG